MLLDRDGGAGGLEGLLGLVRSSLVDLLQDRLRRAVDQVLGLLEAQAGERTHLLDDLDLLVASGLEDDVELILLGKLPRRRRPDRPGRPTATGAAAVTSKVVSNCFTKSESSSSVISLNASSSSSVLSFAISGVLSLSRRMSREG